MKLTNGKLAEIFNRILTDPFSPEIDDQALFERFCTDAAKLLCDYCGGEVAVEAQYQPKAASNDWKDHYVVEIVPNESSPEGGGLWADPAAT